jgi:N6-L-threonylcarbamoyladenine synthase
LSERERADLAASFQAAVADVLADRVGHALEAMPEAGLLVVAGGVAANGTVRSRLTALAGARGIGFAAPPLRLCTDNAVMVGWAAVEGLRAGMPAGGLGAAPRPRWPLGGETVPGETALDEVSAGGVPVGGVSADGMAAGGTSAGGMAPGGTAGA